MGLKNINSNIDILGRAFLVNSKGRCLSDKYIIIESDDWGSIRTTTKENFNRFSSISYGNPYLDYDSIASPEDLNALFDTIESFSDSIGNHPVFTFNTVVANPNFQRIADHRFEEYFYEPFTDTINSYYPSQRVFEMWKIGIEAGLIYPQFHGREHLNVPVWMNALRQRDSELLELFNLGSWSTLSGKVNGSLVKIQAALDYEKDDQLEYQKTFLIEGLSLFEEIFGFKADSMIANNYTWSSHLHNTIKMNGVKMMQSMKYQVMPYSNYNKHRLIRRYFGESIDGLTFNVRNCIFEPSLYPPSYDSVSNCMKQIDMAFRFKKPAVISSHRLNYIGVHKEFNRTRSLNLLRTLLVRCLKKWPDVRFISSNQLLDII